MVIFYKLYFTMSRGRVIYYQLGAGYIFMWCINIFTTPPPTTESHWKKNLDPSLIYGQKYLWPPNSQYSSPQTQSLIFAININIATTYLKMVCLLWIAMFLRVISWDDDKVTKIMLFIKEVWGWTQRIFDADKAQGKLKLHRLKNRHIYNLNKTYI